MCGWWKRKYSPRQPVVGLAQAGADHPSLLRQGELLTQPLTRLLLHDEGDDCDEDGDGDVGDDGDGGVDAEANFEGNSPLPSLQLLSLMRTMIGCWQRILL